MDDDEFFTLLTADLLRHTGYDVAVAETGEKAIQLYKKEKESGVPFDTVILDINIRGGMGGGETIKELLLIDHDIRAIVSSGDTRHPLMVDYKKHGFKATLPKPYGVRELWKTVSNVIQKKEVSLQKVHKSID